MKHLIILITILLSGTTIGAIHAQSVIKGYVIDEKTGEPITGATLVEKNTTNGTLTGINGEFSFKLQGQLPATLQVSFVGYRSKEAIVSSANKSIQVLLSEDAQLLNEVVVVGYGTQRRKELTGSVASVHQSVLEQPTLSVDGLLAGAIPGVQVTQNSGQPGEGSTIRIRGGNSVYASNEPLYVIDGFIHFSQRGATTAGAGNIEGQLNPLAGINPQDIESIEVLKDVSAKAIYGSRGSNGVVLVTTKKGKRGKNTVHYQYTLGIDINAKKLKLLNAKEFRTIDRDGLFNSGAWGTFDSERAGKGIAADTDTDWQDAVLQTGTRQTHDISISGGDDRTRYALSGSFTDQKGLVIGTGFKRSSIRLNLDRQLSDNLTVGVTATAARNNQDALNAMTASDWGAGSSSPFKSGITNSLVYALFMPPVLPVKLENGNYNHYNPFEMSELNYYGTAANPVADLNQMKGETIGSTLLGNFYATYNVPQVKGLSLRLSAGTDVNYITQNFFAPPSSSLGINEDIQGRGSIGNRRTDVQQGDLLVTYTRQLGKDHFIDLLGGYTQQKTTTTLALTNVVKLENFDNIGFSSPTERDVTSRKETGSLHSLITRVNYTLKNRYNLTGTFRADKSSRFSARHSWGYFPSVGVSWNVSDEEFFKSKNTFKVRATFGSAGNQEIGFSDFAALLNAGRYGNEQAVIYSNSGNDNLKWETTTEWNLGIDAGLFGDRFTLTADIYHKKTNDLLLKRIVPLSQNNDEQVFNIGNVTNKGVELSISGDVIRSKNTVWTFSANFAKNINTVTDMGDWDKNLTKGLLQADYGQILRVGESVGSFYGYIYDGVNPETGKIILRDIDGDGEINPNDDRTIIGSTQPDFIYGISSSLTLGRWDFFVSLQGSQGNEVYNKLRRHLVESEGASRGRNRSAELLNAWTTTNHTSTPALGEVVSSTYVYSRFIEDGSFLKLRNLSAGYTLPVRCGQQAFKLRLFASAQNLLTITRYKGYDPEVSGGVDTGMYPMARSFSGGFGLTF